MCNITETLGEGLHDYRNLLVLGVLLVETLLGCLVNGFIVILNVMELVTRRSLGSCDSILMCLGLSRFLLQWFLLALYVLVNLVGSRCDLEQVWIIVHTACFFISYVSFWFPAWLCTFYCVRIVKSECSLFIHVRKSFDSWVPFLLAGSIVVSLLSSVHFSYIFHEFYHIFYVTQSRSAPSLLKYVLISVVSSCPPFLILCLTFCLVVDTLWKHTRRMKRQNQSGFREPSMKAHYGALQTMATFFMSFVIYVICFNLYLLRESPLECHVYILILAAYPSAHSVFLVIGNSKLKQTSIEVLKKARCCNAVQTTNTESYRITT